MKRKKYLMFISMMLVFACLALSLTGCMKIGMRKDNVLKRIEDAKYTVSYLPSTSWTVGFQEAGVIIDEIILAKKSDDTNISVVYVFSCRSEAASNWVEEKCNANTEGADNKDFKDFIAYKYDKIVLYGDFFSVSMARGY